MAKQGSEISSSNSPHGNLGVGLSWIADLLTILAFGVGSQLVCSACVSHVEFAD